MKVIIAGSRTVQDYNLVSNSIKLSGYEIDEVVSGGAIGVDQLGERWANQNNIPIKRFLPEWNKYGKSAGCHRNVLMAEYADAFIVIWDGVSKGAKHMFDIATDHGLLVHLVMASNKNVTAWSFE